MAESALPNRLHRLENTTERRKFEHIWGWWCMGAVLERVEAGSSQDFPCSEWYEERWGASQKPSSLWHLTAREKVPKCIPNSKKSVVVLKSYCFLLNERQWGCKGPMECDIHDISNFGISSPKLARFAKFSHSQLSSMYSYRKIRFWASLTHAYLWGWTNHSGRRVPVGA